MLLASFCSAQKFAKFLEFRRSFLQLRGRANVLQQLRQLFGAHRWRGSSSKSIGCHFEKLQPVPAGERAKRASLVTEECEATTNPLLIHSCSRASLKMRCA